MAPRTIGRYHLLNELGQSATGATFVAFDPQLERKVTLFVPSGEPEQTLVLARRLARVAHPNLRTVHDVGELDGTGFVALEQIDGEVLPAWLSAAPRPWSDVQGVLVGAGRALAALHEAGLAHGDVRAERVIVSRDGRALLDLAAVVGGPGHQEHDQSDRARERDQSAFAEIVADALRKSPGCPSSLFAIAERARSPDPDHSFPSARALVDALEHDPRRWRRRLIGAGAVLGALAIVAAAAAQGRSDRICGDATEVMHKVWNDTESAAIRGSLRATGQPFADDAAREVARVLDLRAEEWILMHTEACEATHVHDQQSEQILDLRMACLRDRHQELESLLEVLREADATVARESVRAAAALTPIARCGDVGLLTARQPQPEDPALEEPVAGLRRRIGQAAAKRDAGQFASALALILDIASDAEPLDHPPLTAEVAVVHGEILASAGDHREAEIHLRDAIRQAWRGHHDEVAAQAWVSLVRLVGEKLARPADARIDAGHAGAAIARIGGDSELEAELERSLGVLAWAEGRYQAAVEHHRRALGLKESIFEAPHFELARTLNNLANAHTSLGEYDQALTLYDRALGMWLATVGPNHPEVASVHNNLGALHHARGNLESAHAELLLAHGIREQTLGPTHPDVASSLNNLAVIADSLGRSDEALARHRRVLEIRRLIHGNDHPDVADSLLNIGVILQSTGNLKEAGDSYAKALEIYERTVGTNHPYTALALHNLGRVFAESRRFDEALVMHRRALKIRTESLGENHDQVLISMRALAETLVSLGKIPEAIELFQQALEISERAELTESELRPHRLRVQQLRQG